MIGIDIIEVSRIERLAARSSRFLTRVFTPSEVEYINSCKNKYQRMAGIFAAKEAAVKAAGGVISDYEILHSPAGKPYTTRGKEKIELSISHEQNYAIAMAILGGEL